MYIEEQQSTDNSQIKDFIFKDVSFKIEKICESRNRIYPSRTLISELKSCYEKYVGYNKHENPWDLFADDFYIQLVSTTPTCVMEASITYTMETNEIQKFKNKNVKMDIILLKKDLIKT